MSEHLPTQSKTMGIPKIVWWTALPCLMLALGLVINVVSNRPSPGAGPGVFLLPVAYAFEVSMVFLLLWTPALGITLTVCALFPASRSFCKLNAWIVFLVLLIPFYLMFRAAETSPVLGEYLKMLHLKP